MKPNIVTLRGPFDGPTIVPKWPILPPVCFRETDPGYAFPIHPPIYDKPIIFPGVFPGGGGVGL